MDTHESFFFFNEGIGDGGNELGMGKVKEAVRRHIKNGDVIACDVEADFTIVAGKLKKVKTKHLCSRLILVPWAFNILCPILWGIEHPHLSLVYLKMENAQHVTGMNFS